MATPLSLEQYAIAMAHVAFFEAEGIDAVLQQLHVDSSAYRGARDHWTTAMAGEFDEDEAPLALQFGSAFREAKTKLETDKPRLEAVEPLLEPVAVGQDFSPVDTTSALGVPALADDALPFEHDPRSDPPVNIIMERSIDDSGMTGSMAALDVPDEALPFSQTPLLSLTQYASLCAELAYRPAAHAEVLARYGVSTPEQHAALKAQFDAQMAGDANTRSEFEQLVSTYLSWLKQQGSPS